jgi:hypothetical protein
VTVAGAGDGAANGRVIVDKRRPSAPPGADVVVTHILVVTDGLQPPADADRVRSKVS